MSPDIITTPGETSGQAMDASTATTSAIGATGDALTPRDVTHNMKVIIALDSVFTIGVVDLMMAMNPLWVFLGTSPTRIGLINSLSILALIGVTLSPLISVHFKYKKWYLFVAHLPYIGMWLLMGLAVLLHQPLGLTKAGLLLVLTALVGANHFFGGFVGLPHQEYVAACIPMSHRGRYSSWSQGFGATASILITILGGWILSVVVEPNCFGYLLVMAWLFCQGGYVLALFGRERPTPIENAPRPWSRAMFQAAWQDKPFLRLILTNALFMIFLWPVFNIFLQTYGFSVLKLAAVNAAGLMMITNIARIAAAGPIGVLTDRLHPRRILPFWPLLAAFAIGMALIMPNRYGIYVATFFGAIFMIGQTAAFTALIYGLPKPENRSGHYTLQMIQSYICNAIGPFLVGVFCDRITYRGAFVAMVVIAILLVPVTQWLLRGISTDNRDYA